MPTGKESLVQITSQSPDNLYSAYIAALEHERHCYHDWYESAAWKPAEERWRAARPSVERLDQLIASVNYS